MLVALNHAGVSFLQGGYVGVDVFFVISGFLITGFLLRRQEQSGRVPFSEFYAARARRILPAATLTIVATVVASWHYLNYVRALSVFHDAIWSTFFAANIHFAQVGTNYFAQDNPPSPLQNFWTLAVEEQFYIVWPALLALLLIATRGTAAAPGGSDLRALHGVADLLHPRHRDHAGGRVLLHHRPRVGARAGRAHRDARPAARTAAGEAPRASHVGGHGRDPDRRREVLGGHAVPRVRGAPAGGRLGTRDRRRAGRRSEARGGGGAALPAVPVRGRRLVLRSTCGTGRSS